MKGKAKKTWKEWLVIVIASAWMVLMIAWSTCGFVFNDDTAVFGGLIGMVAMSILFLGTRITKLENLIKNKR